MANESPEKLFQTPNLSYDDQLKQDFYRIIDALDDITRIQKDYLKQRWLGQVLWMEDRSGEMRNWHRRLRMGMIVGSSLVPLVIAIDSHCNSTLQQVLKLIIVGLSVLVTVSATVDEFFGFGERWYNYRKAVELLKSQGWQFLELSGTYREYIDHAEAFPVFTDQIESIIQRDVEVYVTQGIQQKEQQQKTDKRQSDNSGPSG
jgi:type III secretory pathway component EscS